MLAASVTIILLLIVLGYRLPRHLVRSRAGGPSASRGAFFLVGLFVYPLMVLLALLGAGAHVPPAVVLAAIVLEIVLLALWFLRHLGSERNERHLLAFGLGLLMLGMSLGLWTEFPLELVAVADAAVLYLFYRLDQRFARAASASTASATPAPPPPGPPVTPTRT